MRDPASPHVPIGLLITANDALIGRVIANRPRTDLVAAGLGDGRYGFELRLVRPLSPLERQVIAVRRESDGAHMPGSPCVLPEAGVFDTTVQLQLARLLADAQTAPDLRSRLEFLATQTDALLQRAADAANPALTREALRRHRWRWGGDVPQMAAARRALVIDETLPQAGRDAGSEAVISHMLSLMRLGYAVTFAPADMTGGADAAALGALGIAVAHAPWTASVEEILRREADGFDLVYLHRVGIAQRYGGLVRHHQRRARVVFSVADLHHLRLMRQAHSEARPELHRAALHLRAQETAAIAGADAVITHSTREAALMQNMVPGAPVHRVAWVTPSRPTEVPFAARSGVAFIGYFGHPPNVDAAHFLVDEIMPLVRAQNPAIACVLVGRGLPDSLARARDGVVVLGHVPDLATVFDTVRLTVAPLAYGAGVKGKVLVSLAAGVPCVGTPIAAEGLDLPPLLAAQMAADAAGIAALILRLHEDAALATACREAGLQWIATTCSEAAVDLGMAKAAGLEARYPSST